MKNLTYKQLQEAISKMTAEQRDMNVSVYVNGFDEFYPIEVISFIDEDGVLDKGHPVLNTPEE